MGKDEQIVTLTSLIIGVFIVILINRINRVKPGAFLNVLIAILISFGLTGQILLINDALPHQETKKLEYQVVNKSIDSRLPKSYLIALEYDKNHGCIVTVDNKEYKQVKKGDKLYLTVCNGGLGISYIENRERDVEIQLNT